MVVSSFPPATLQAATRMKGYTTTAEASSTATPKKVPINTIDPAFSNTNLTGGSTNRITITKSGTVNILGRVQVASGTCVGRIRKNGSGTDLAVGNTSLTSIVSTGPIAVVEGDYFELWRTASGTQAIVPGIDSTYLHATEGAYFNDLFTTAGSLNNLGYVTRNGTTDPRVVGGYAYAAAAGLFPAETITPFNTADQYISTTVTQVSAAASSMLCLRTSGTTTSGTFCAANFTDTIVNIWTATSWAFAGAVRRTDNTAISLKAGDFLEFYVYNNLYCFCVNGKLQASWDDTGGVVSTTGRRAALTVQNSDTFRFADLTTKDLVNAPAISLPAGASDSFGTFSGRKQLYG